MKLGWSLPLFVLATLAGCKSADLPDYSTSRDTLFHLQQLPPAKVSVGDFTGGPRSLKAAAEGIVCELEVRDHPDGRPFDYREYIEQSLIEELEAAGRYEAAAVGPQITGTIEHLSLQRELPFKGTWIIVVQLASSNGAQLQVRSDHDFDVGDLAGPSACGRSIKAFAPAVQDVIETAVRSREFAALLAGA